MRISFAGDVCLHEIETSAFSIDPAIAGLLEGSDLAVANLECPLTISEDPVPYKATLIKAAPAPNRILDLFDAFSVANNHILDYRERGVLDTLEFLAAAKKRWFGAGKDAGDALRPLVIEIEGLRIAFLAFTRWSTAGRRTAGSAPDKLRAIVRSIRELREEGCFVVVYPHWNYEFVDYPAPSNRRVARRLIDAGADLIVGSHPHVIQGHETYAGRSIFHSLGNFVFRSDVHFADRRDDLRINQTFILTVEIDRDQRYRTAIHPVFTDGAGIRILAGPERDRFMARLEGISEALKDERLSRAGFYRAFVDGAGRADPGMAKMVRRQGIGYLLSRLHKVRLQDLTIKAYALARRLARR